MNEQPKPTHISKETYNRILETVSLSLRERGFKATTMDLIASQLSMSKRTLYEIFENKDQMFVETIKYSRRILKAVITRIFTQSSTVIEALVKVLRFHLAEMKRVNPVFFMIWTAMPKRCDSIMTMPRLPNLIQDLWKFFRQESVKVYSEKRLITALLYGCS